MHKEAQTEAVHGPHGSAKLTAGLVSDGVVAAVVPKLELEGAAAKGLAQHLVPHADAKHGLLAQNLLGVLHSVGTAEGSPCTTGSTAQHGGEGDVVTETHSSRDAWIRGT